MQCRKANEIRHKFLQSHQACCGKTGTRNGDFCLMSRVAFTGLGVALFACRTSVGGGLIMSRINRNSCDVAEANRFHLGAPSISAAGIRNLIRLLALALTALTLAACAQSTIATNKSELVNADPQATRVGGRTTGTDIARINAPVATNKSPASKQIKSFGLASFYAEGHRTANGETFDPYNFTAAHRTLPFGTRLRVTSLTTGRSVTVRVNDRGPYVPGRVIDVSYSAAKTLGIVRRGVAMVKLDVVQ
jgi:rare lipoprotein A